MNQTIFTSISRAGVFASGCLFFAAVSRAADKAPSDAFPNYDSYIKVSGQAAAISGSDTAFQSRTRQPSDGGAGIEEMHIAKDLSKTTTMVIDGKAMAG